MPTYTQANRELRIDTTLGEDVLLLEGFVGEEVVSQPFHFTIDLLSEKPDLEPSDLLRKPVVVSVQVPEAEPRYIHGVVMRFAQFGSDVDSGLTAYRAEVVPWLWLLSLSSDCRIFQNKKAPDIVKQVFADYGFSDFEDRLTKSYPVREYTVQYRESHLNFVSRLMEEEGISYFFEHKFDKHVLVLADAPGQVKACPGLRTVRMGRQGTNTFGDADVVTMLHREHALHTDKIVLTDYNWLTPSTSLLASEAGQGQGAPAEGFDYPGNYAQKADGARLARIRLEEMEARHHVVRGSGLVRTFVAGHKFDLTEHYRDDMNASYHLLRVRHAGKQGGYRAGSDVQFDYVNDFEAIPADVPYRPPRLAQAPRAYGTQSALVVGPAGEEIHTNGHGQVKLHFYWDRYSKKDENSSMWIRCSFAWAGKGWGQFSVPRIGQEVLVEFVEGEPDRPVVVGRVYNAEQTPPCDPSGKGGVVSGLRSKTHKGSGANWMEMTDTAGKELIDIHAQYDMNTKVEHDDTQTVVNDRTITVTGKHTETITKDTTIKVTEGNLLHQVVAGTATYYVKGKVAETYDDSQDTIVAKEVKIQAGDKITLLTGDSSIVMEKNGKITIHGKNIEVIGDTDVKISGPDVKMTGGQKANVGVGNQQLTMDVAKVSVSGAAINSSAIGTHEIVGALVKIN